MDDRAWTSLGTVQYRKILVYEDLDWDEEDEVEEEGVIPRLDEMQKVAPAERGGPLAMIPMSSSSVAVRILIYSQSGRRLACFKWECLRSAGSPPVAMGWTEEERLVLVSAGGVAQLRDVIGSVLKEVDLLEGLQLDHVATDAARVQTAEVFSDGVAALMGDGKLRAVRGIHSASPSIFGLVSGLGGRQVTAMAVIDPALAVAPGEREDDLEVILATEDCDLISAGRASAKARLLDPRLESPIVCLARAPNGGFFAYFTRGGMLAVVSSDLSSRVLDFDTSIRDPPLQMVWCGEDCVLLHWKGLGVLMVGPYGDWERHEYPSSQPLLLISELDCGRILTNSGLELLQRVPTVVEAIGQIGSTDPAAMLYDATEAFEDGDPKADENIRSMGREQLTEAVHSCLTAACQEVDAERQKFLLRAASYGKGFLLQEFDSDEFVDACRRIRVLNALRDPDVGLPLTFFQLEASGIESLVPRLISRRMHWLALTICDYLRLSKSRVVVDWACCRLSPAISRNESDLDLRDVICDRMSLCGPDTSYAQVARAAAAAGRRGLATLLLDREPLASSQVPLLLEVREMDLALGKAVESGSDDLIFLVLQHMSSAPKTSAASSVMDRDAFFSLVHSRPEALRLLRQYYAARTSLADQRHLHDLHVFRGDYCAAAGLALTAAYSQERLADRLAGLKEVERLYGQSRELSFQQTCTRDQIGLLEAQKELEERTDMPGAFVDLSLSKTVHAIISATAALSPMAQGPLMAEAGKLQRRFKMPEGHFWHVKVRALAETSQWGALRIMAHEKRSPIGFRPFALACMRASRVDEAEGYIERIPSAEEKFSLYMTCQSWVKAAQVASKMRDVRRLQEVRRVCGEPALQASIDEMLLPKGGAGLGVATF
jgi:hypothetical protein